MLNRRGGALETRGKSCSFRYLRKPRLGHEEAVDFGVGREAAKLLLREQQLSVSEHLERSAARLHEVDLGGAIHEPGPRPEGLRFVVSHHAVFDAELHDRPVRWGGGVVATIPRGRKCVRTTRSARSRGAGGPSATRRR